MHNEKQNHPPVLYPDSRLCAALTPTYPVRDQSNEPGKRPAMRHPEIAEEEVVEFYNRRYFKKYGDTYDELPDDIKDEVWNRYETLYIATYER